MSENIELIIRLISAMLLGGIIGIEREYRAKDAGFRTHFLVSVGSALFCVVSQYGFGDEVKDASRVAAQVVSGIGFLGAGTIIFQKNVIRGLTTAAGLWVTAAIGLACGTGMMLLATVVTVLVLVGLEVINAYLPQVSTTSIAVTFTSYNKDSVEEAIDHIARHSTGHSEAILTRTQAHADLFTAAVDSAAVYVNCSTRFTDGGEFGLGCEMGISTQKLHARGPMGLDELSTYKYIIRGSGQIR